MSIIRTECGFMEEGALEDLWESYEPQDLWVASDQLKEVMAGDFAGPDANKLLAAPSGALPIIWASPGRRWACIWTRTAPKASGWFVRVTVNGLSWAAFFRHRKGSGIARRSGTPGNSDNSWKRITGRPHEGDRGPSR